MAFKIHACTYTGLHPENEIESLDNLNSGWEPAGLFWGIVGMRTTDHCEWRHEWYKCTKCQQRFKKVKYRKILSDRKLPEPKWSLEDDPV